MLIDRCVIEVRSGKGGNGCIAFLHDRQTAMGGPDGGNGGRGGSIYLKAVRNVNTLYNFRHSKTIAACDGENGNKKNMYGHSAEDVTVEVPVGTVVSEEKTGQILADLKKEGDVVLVAKGGRGGRGNAAYKSSRNRCPKIAENGLPGERKRLVLELKIVADAGIIGFPSVGKSTFLNIVTKANVETADYPFTTISPNLGVASTKEGKEIVLADMPGLIEGAHQGKGLGIQFLRHIERCRILLHFVSMSGERDPYEDYLSINDELVKYGADLEKRPQIVIATKMDEDGAEDRKRYFDEKIGFASIGLSALTNQGVDELLYKAVDLAEKTPEFPLKGLSEEGKIKIYDAHLDESVKSMYEIKKINDHTYQIVGDRVERTYSIINNKTEQGIRRLINYLDSIGIEKALAEAGAKDGDTVILKDFEFEYTE